MRTGFALHCCDVLVPCCPSHLTTSNATNCTGGQTTTSGSGSSTAAALARLNLRLAHLLTRNGVEGHARHRGAHDSHFPRAIANFPQELRTRDSHRHDQNTEHFFSGSTACARREAETVRRKAVRCEGSWTGRGNEGRLQKFRYFFAREEERKRSPKIIQRRSCGTSRQESQKRREVIGQSLQILPESG